MRSASGWELDHRGDVAADAVGAAGHAAADALADDEHVRPQAPQLCGAAGAGREGVRLVDDQQGAVRGGQPAKPVQEPGLRPHDPDVGERRLGQDRRDVAVGELLLDARQVVELRHPRGHVQRHRRTRVARSRDGLAAQAGHGERLVHRAVVAVREGEHLRPTGRQPGEAQRPTVGVGRRQRERPQRQPEAPGQLGADPLCVGGGKHRRGAAEAVEALGDSVEHRLRAVARHRAGVAEGEVDVLAPIHVHDPVPAGPLEVQREPAAPLGHPRHRHPAEQVVRRAEEPG